MASTDAHSCSPPFGHRPGFGGPSLKSKATSSHFVHFQGPSSLIIPRTYRGLRAEAIPLAPDACLCNHACMPRKGRRPSAPPEEDVNQIAARLVAAISGEQPKPTADTRRLIGRAFGLLGASKGGKARAKKLSKARRSAIAKKAAAARWRDRSR
jgi:hypothetical protein